MSLYVNKDRTVLVRRYENGVIEVCTRESEHHSWGAPVVVELENQ